MNYKKRNKLILFSLLVLVMFLTSVIATAVNRPSLLKNIEHDYTSNITYENLIEDTEILLENWEEALEKGVTLTDISEKIDEMKNTKARIIMFKNENENNRDISFSEKSTNLNRLIAILECEISSLKNIIKTDEEYNEDTVNLMNMGGSKDLVINHGDSDQSDYCTCFIAGYIMDKRIGTTFLSCKPETCPGCSCNGWAWAKLGSMFVWIYPDQGVDVAFKGKYTATVGASTLYYLRIGDFDSTVKLSYFLYHRWYDWKEQEWKTSYNEVRFKRHHFDENDWWWWHQYDKYDKKFTKIHYSWALEENDPFHHVYWCGIKGKSIISKGWGFYYPFAMIDFKLNSIKLNW